MKWRADGPAAITSECGRFTINRSPAPGFPVAHVPAGGITYMLVDGKAIAHVERHVPDTHADTLAATQKLKALAREIAV